MADGGYVYWIDTLAVSRTPAMKLSQYPEKLYSGNNTLGDLAIDQGNVYFTVPQKDQVVRMALDGSSPVTLAQELVGNGPTRIALDAINVYWRTPSGIRTASKIGTNQSPTVVYPTTNMPDGPMVMRLDVAYWTQNGELWRAVPKSGGWNSGQLKTGLQTVFAMATTPDYVYWSQWDQSQLWRAKLDGTNPSQMAGCVAQSKAMVSRDGNVYWSHGKWIMMYSTGPWCQSVIQLIDDPIGLAIDDGAIYWATQNSIMGLAR
jgi:hypothetical protein